MANQIQMTIETALVSNAENLEVDCAKELLQKVTDGSVHEEVERALTYCTDLFKDSRRRSNESKLDSRVYMFFMFSKPLVSKISENRCS